MNHGGCAAPGGLVGLAILTACLGCGQLLGFERAFAEDASVPGDASITEDAGPDPGAPFCAGRTGVFCADFDRASTPDQGFTYHSERGYSSGGTFALDRTLFVSSPASLHLAIPAGTPGPPGFVNRLGWELTRPAAATAVHFEGQLRLNNLDPTNKAYVLALEFQGPPIYTLSLLASGSGTAMEEIWGVTGEFGSALTDFAEVIPTRTWLRVEIDVSSTPRKATVRVGGREVLSKGLDAGAPAGFQQVSLGPRIYTERAVQAIDINFDNIGVDIR